MYAGLIRICTRLPYIFLCVLVAGRNSSLWPSLEFNVGSFEPVFCTVYLYDLQHRVKVSEEFHFDLNDDKRLALVGKTREVRQPSEAHKQCAYSVLFCSCLVV